MNDIRRELSEDDEIEMGETFQIDEYADIARDFLITVFNIDYDECFISDESTLSDFSGCCIPDSYEPGFEGGYEEAFKLGRDNMAKIINEHYGINVDPYDYLVTTFEKIKQNQNRKLN